MGHGAGDNMTAAVRKDGFKGTPTKKHDGCDHTTLMHRIQSELRS